MIGKVFDRIEGLRPVCHKDGSSAHRRVEEN